MMRRSAIVASWPAYRSCDKGPSALATPYLYPMLLIRLQRHAALFLLLLLLPAVTTSAAAAPDATQRSRSSNGLVEVWHPPVSADATPREHVIAWIPAGGAASKVAQGRLVGVPSLRAGFPLPPDRAFMLDAIARSPTELLVRWTMPHGYYLYRDRTALALDDRQGATLDAPRWPSGVLHDDANFGRSVVYFDEVDLPVPLLRNSADAHTVDLRVTFQGCQDGGICYPLMVRTLQVSLPAASAQQIRAMQAYATPTAASSLPPPATPMAVHPATLRASGPGALATKAGNQSHENKLAGWLGGHGLAAIALSFGLGLLLVLMFCALPIVADSKHCKKSGSDG